MINHVLHSVQEATSKVEPNSTTALWHIVQQELAKHGTVVLHHVPYFPHIARCDIILFAQLKTMQCCHYFNSGVYFKANMTDALHSVKRDVLQSCF
jgi:hypothetical protein